MLARQFAVGFGVAIVFPLLIYYGVSTLSPAPKWNDYHNTVVAAGPLTPEQRAAQQDKVKSENTAFADAQRVFSLRLLCISAPLGYAALLLGAWRQNSGLGTGLMFGGIFAVVDGYWGHWGFIEDWLRFTSLLIALAVLVFIHFRLLPSRNPSGVSRP